jgi:hypothetical protein
LSARSDPIHRVATVHGESEMTEVSSLRRACRAATDQHENEVALATCFCEPCDCTWLTRLTPTMDAVQLAQVFVESNRGFEVAHVQREVRESGSHVDRIRPRAHDGKPPASGMQSFSSALRAVVVPE